MIYSHFNNSRVRYIYERYLRPMYIDKTISNEEVLKNNGLVSIHKNIETLAV